MPNISEDMLVNTGICRAVQNFLITVENNVNFISSSNDLAVIQRTTRIPGTQMISQVYPSRCLFL